ncbi:hypothetical protein EDM22_04470 [Agromyces tardus]|jgi:hypothetical protein|uniref:Uncharacterized protein n=1 Tax=Agromyces tardus TaxID=2583849 RepID=A0A3M8AJC7_9MICO|nr:hypothetical protein [Agromyces tardus]RNB51291.1 hypothetical protein EDM22_04470 [Agromyces tardus]
MRKVLWLAAGVTVVSAAAFFMGAAAAMTGAPVFYDARYPQEASPAVDGYEASAAESTPAPPGAVAEREGDVPAGADGGDAAPAPQETPVAQAPDAEQPDGRATAPTPTDEPPQAPRRGTPSGEFGVPGGPAPDDAPGGPPTPEDQHAWLAFQQIVRECMSAQGQEYLYWEWWNYQGDGSNRYPAMPADLTHREAAAWELALNGTSRGGDQYRWERAGCWGFAGHRIGAVG